MAMGVGIGGLVIAHFFATYSRVWERRLEEAARIEGSLQGKMEAG
jgi:hypothetical protein